MTNILLLTDFSKNANNAIGYGMQLFRGEPCNFYVLNVQKISKYITSDLLTSPNKTVYDAVIKNPKKKLNILVNDLKREYASESYTIDGICNYDSFISSVKQVIQSKNIDLIIMGTNGVSGIKETVFGSNTVHVLKNITLPTLVVPENYKFTKPENILFIYDTKFNDDSIKPLMYFISKFNASLKVSAAKKENQNNIITSIFNGVNIDFIKTNYSLEKNTIEQIVAKYNIEMISKIINTKSFFKRVFSTSTSTNLTYASKVPLLFL